MEIIWQDVLYAFRMLRKDRIVTVVIISTLGLSIGMNTTIFSVVNSFLLRPLPVKHARQLMVLAISHPGANSPHGLSYLDMLDVGRRANAFAAMSGCAVGFAGLSDQGYAERIAVSYVTGNYFDMLGVRPSLGRLILPTEGQTAGGDPVVVLGYQYWERRFGGNRLVIGRTVKINAHPFTVIGIVSRDFRGTYSMLDMDAFLPISMIGIESGNGGDTLRRRDNHRLNVLARLRPGVTPGLARAQLQAIADQLGKEYPETDKALRTYIFPEMLARPQPANALSNPPLAGIFLGLAGLLLLIASINGANILLVRFTSRDRELAIRAALGASRMRLIRQLLIEGIVIALLGGVAGVLIGEFGAKALGSIRLPIDVPIDFDFSLDWRVFAYIAAITLLTALLIGLVPAFRSSRMCVGDSLRENRATGPRTHQRMRNVLVAAEVAGAVILVTTASLFVQSVGALRSVHLGFRADHLLNLVMDPGQIGYNQSRTEGFYRELEQRAGSIPSIESASLAFAPPLSDYTATSWVTLEGQALQPNDRGLPVNYNIVGIDYFKTMGIPLLKGRAFAEFDSQKSPPVAIINETLAERLWPGQNPLGKHFSYKGLQGPFVEVVGLTATGKYGALSETPQPFFYLPILQQYTSFRVLQARTAVAPDQAAKELEGLIRSIEPDLPVSDIHTMEDLLEGGNGFFPYHIAEAVTGVLGLLALVLGILGVYGVVSFATIQRTHEIGVRLALGAQSRDIVNLVLRSGLRVVIAGVVVGVLAMLGISQVLRSLLFGIKPNDLSVYAIVGVILLLVAISACLLPARRATKIDPMDVLRYE